MTYPGPETKPDHSFTDAIAALLEAVEVRNAETLPAAIMMLRSLEQWGAPPTEADSLLACHLAQHLERETSLTQEKPAPPTFQETMLDTLRRSAQANERSAATKRSRGKP